MRNVLLIGSEDLSPLARALQDEGFRVTLRIPGETGGSEVDAFESLRSSHEVVVLDLTALGEDPVSKRFLESAQNSEGPPVIVLLQAAQIAESDPWREADDFMLKESSPQELLSRVRQALWKRHRVDTRNVLKCGELVIDLAGYTVSVNGRAVELTFKEYELLRFLATSPDRVFTRETLLNKVWGYDFYGGARTVDVHIRRLRSKIEDRYNTFIETVRNVGYRFRAG